MLQSLFATVSTLTVVVFFAMASRAGETQASTRDVSGVERANKDQSTLATLEPSNNAQQSIRWAFVATGVLTVGALILLQLSRRANRVPRDHS